MNTSSFKLVYFFLPSIILHHFRSTSIITSNIDKIPKKTYLWGPTLSIRTPNRKQNRKNQKTSENNRPELWTAMTRSLELIIEFFEYYSASMVTQTPDLEESTPTHEFRYQIHVLVALN